MQRRHSLLLAIGAVLLFFGIASIFFTAQFGLYSVVHVIGGLLLLGRFVAGSFRDLGSLLSARSTRYGANMVVYSVLFVALLTGINWMGVRYNQRWDVTEEGVFSLSPQARKVLESLDGDIHMQAFLEGGSDPAIEDALESFQAASPRVKVQRIDPDAQPELTQKYGIRTYGTVRVEYGDQSTSVAEPTEEALTNAIIKVTRAERQVVYFLQGQGERGIDDLDAATGFGLARQDLENENYDVRPLLLLTEGEVPDDAAVVVAAPSREPQPQEIEALGRYLEGGGNMLLLLPPRQGEALRPLLDRYGVSIGDDTVVDQVLRLFEGPSLGLNPVAETYGVHPITEGFGQRTIFPLTRSVSPADEVPDGVTATSLVKTSAASWAETDLDMLYEKSEAALDPGRDSEGPVSIAVASTRHSEGDAEAESRLVAFGTAGFADNKNINLVFNRDLFLNVVGWLGGQEELLSIRPKSIRASRIEFTEEQATTIFYLSILVVPELLLLIGLSVWWRRSSL